MLGVCLMPLSRRSKMVKVTLKKIPIDGHWVVSRFGIVNSAAVNVGVHACV